MKSKSVFCLMAFLLVAQTAQLYAQTHPETPAQHDARMQWWREARFGMFIHWGLYSILAGEWKGVSILAECIRTTAQIPLEEYDQLVPR
ncbi:MAG: alpha-L-fucosidase, partial [candidate division KSB1 bacterium]